MTTGKTNPSEAPFKHARQPHQNGQKREGNFVQEMPPETVDEPEEIDPFADVAEDTDAETEPEIFPDEEGEAPDHTRLISCSLRRNYGGVEIEFKIEAWAAPQNLLEQTAEFDKLYQQLTYQHEHFSTDHLPKIRNLTSGGNSNQNQRQPGQNDGYPMVEYTLKEIVKEVVEGQERWKARTTSGKYAKYGAPIYIDDPELKMYDFPALLGAAYKFTPKDTVKVKIEERPNGKAAVKGFAGLQ